MRELAPALLAVNDLLQNANRVLNADRATLAVKVQSDFKTGSFDIGLCLMQAVMQAVTFFPDPVKSAKEIAEYVGLVRGADVNVLGLLKWLRGRTPQATTTLENGKVEISVRGDNNKVEVKVVQGEVYQVASDPLCRKAVEEVVKPVRVQGIDTFMRYCARPAGRVRQRDHP